MDTMDGLSMDLERANLDKLRGVFPECFAEGKLDIDKLLGLCGEYIDNDFEKYRFEWKGKAECLRLAQKRSAGTLRPCPGESVDWEHTRNLYIEGDNLEVLKLLQTAYYRKVKMIYIDPPYNTGNDFVYADDFADPLARYREVTAQTTKSNPETMGRFHTNWLNMMYPRLRLAANLLRDDGVFFISIDDNEMDNLKKICNEVFGEENFLGMILWKKKTNGNNMGFIPPVHDYILAYARSIVDIKDIGYDVTEEHISKTYSNPDNDPRGPWTTMDLSANHKGPYFTITNPVTGETFNPPEGRYWVFNEEEVKKRIADGRIIFGKTGTTRPVQKVFAAERIHGKIRAESWWDKHGMNEDATTEMRELFGQGKLFTHPKPSKLIYNLVKIATSNSDDIILDFFSGSATTAHAVMSLNAEDNGKRRFILVQLPEKTEIGEYPNICEIGKERIRRAGKKLMQQVTSGVGNIKGEGYGCGMPTTKSEWETAIKEIVDVGFRVFKLDSSNLKTWDAAPIDPQAGDVIGELANRMNAMIHRVKPDRSDLDMVFEVMLKLGMPLDFPVTEVSVNGKTAYSVGEDCLLLVCLAPDIQPEDVEQMAEYAPAKAVISRDSFADDTAMANAWYILRDRGVDLKLV